MFGDVVRAYRRRLGITQEELAHKTGVSVRGIRKIEANQTAAPRPVTVRLLAEAFALAGNDRDRFCESALAEVSDQPPRRLTPALLPADVTGFIGRTGQLARLDAIAAAAADQPTAVVVCAVSGTAGVGPNRQHHPQSWTIGPKRGGAAVRRQIVSGIVFVAVLLGMGIPAANANAADGVRSTSISPTDKTIRLQVRQDGSVAPSGKVGTQTVFGPFNIRAAHSGSCLDVTGGTGATGNGVRLQQYQCLGAGQTNQQWYFTDTGDGVTYYITARHSGKCLDVTGGTGAVGNGVPIQQYQCLGYGQSNQRWFLTNP